MRLIHAVRDLNASGPASRSQTIALYTEAEHARDVRARGRRRLPARSGRGAALPRPRRAGAGAASRPAPTRSGSGWGFVAEDPAFADLCERLGRHLHRPERRGDAQAGRQDRLQADRRGGRRPGRPVEPGRRRHPGGRARRRGPGRLPADAQGDRRRRRPRHPDGRRPGRPGGRLPAHPRRGRSAPSAAAWSSSSGWSPAPATSRCR